MKTLTISDIRDLKPCYDPATKVAEDWQGTVIDILRLENVPKQDRIWVVTHFLGDKTNRLFAVWCAREALSRIKNPDPCSITACDVAERFAHGDATVDELRTAARAARAAADAALAHTRQIEKLIKIIEQEGE